MSEIVTQLAEWSEAVIEIMGVCIILVFSFYALVAQPLWLLMKGKTDNIFGKVRQSLGRGILLGLEFLVAADIIHTVAVSLSFKTVGVLALVVLIRTFLSFTLEVELDGRWPWQGKK
ncbi:MAG: DUF1622 domain-containing protein [Halomonas sp.]|nr:DUF1622 domain-containing protein [Halomonas sp.]